MAHGCCSPLLNGEDTVFLSVLEQDRRSGKKERKRKEGEKGSEKEQRVRRTLSLLPYTHAGCTLVHVRRESRDVSPVIQRVRFRLKGFFPPT